MYNSTSMVFNQMSDKVKDICFWYQVTDERYFGGYCVWFESVYNNERKQINHILGNACSLKWRCVVVAGICCPRVESIWELRLVSGIVEGFHFHSSIHTFMRKKVSLLADIPCLPFPANWIGAHFWVEVTPPWVPSTMSCQFRMVLYVSFSLRYRAYNYLPSREQMCNISML